MRNTLLFLLCRLNLLCLIFEVVVSMNRSVQLLVPCPFSLYLKEGCDRLNIVLLSQNKITEEAL